MEVLNTYFKFLLDKNNRISNKFFTIIIVFTALLVIDFQFGFSEHIFYNNKIEELQNVTKIIEDPNADINVKKHAYYIREKIIHRENAYSLFSSFFHSINPTNDASIKDNVDKINANNNTQSKSIIRNNFIFLISISGLIIIASIIGMLFILFGSDTFKEKIGGILLTIYLGVSLSALFYFLAGLIPQISKTTWLYNYILNAFIQLSPIIYITVRNLTIILKNKKTKRIMKAKE